jgi:hypothetical protein
MRFVSRDSRQQAGIHGVFDVYFSLGRKMNIPVQSEFLDPARLTGKSSALALWVRRTPNVFRGVLELDCTSKTVEEAAIAVRDAVTAEYSPGLIIPFAFGAVLYYTDTSPNAADVEHLIDDRARSRATWQWIIIVNKSSKHAYGVHMWMRGYLTPVYEALINHFEYSGYVCHSATKAPSKFWNRLWGTMAAMFKVRRVALAVGAVLVVVGLLLRLFSVA